MRGFGEKVSQKIASARGEILNLLLKLARRPRFVAATSQLCMVAFPARSILASGFWRDPPSLRFRLRSITTWRVGAGKQVMIRPRLASGATRGCAGHRTREHCALSGMLTVSQLSKSDNLIETEFLPLTS
jgi:hypothetical protein